MYAPKEQRPENNGPQHKHRDEQIFSSPKFDYRHRFDHEVEEQEADAFADDFVNGKNPELPGPKAGIKEEVQPKLEDDADEEDTGSMVMAKGKGTGGAPPDGKAGAKEGYQGSIAQRLKEGRSVDRYIEDADRLEAKIRADQEAASMAESIHARAFTKGDTIYFNSGEYQPETREGQWLIAHEMAHVAQGGKGVKRKEKEGGDPFRVSFYVTYYFPVAQGDPDQIAVKYALREIFSLQGSEWDEKVDEIIHLTGWKFPETFQAITGDPPETVEVRITTRTLQGIRKMLGRTTSSESEQYFRKLDQAQEVIGQADENVLSDPTLSEEGRTMIIQAALERLRMEEEVASDFDPMNPPAKLATLWWRILGETKYVYDRLQLIRTNVEGKPLLEEKLNQYSLDETSLTEVMGLEQIFQQLNSMDEFEYTYLQDIRIPKDKVVSKRKNSVDSGLGLLNYAEYLRQYQNERDRQQADIRNALFGLRYKSNEDSAEELETLEKAILNAEPPAIMKLELELRLWALRRLGNTGDHTDGSFKLISLFTVEELPALLKTLKTDNWALLNTLAANLESYERAALFEVLNMAIMIDRSEVSLIAEGLKVFEEYDPGISQLTQYEDRLSDPDGKFDQQDNVKGRNILPFEIHSVLGDVVHNETSYDVELHGEWVVVRIFLDSSRSGPLHIPYEENEIQGFERGDANIFRVFRYDEMVGVHILHTTKKVGSEGHGGTTTGLAYMPAIELLHLDYLDYENDWEKFWNVLYYAGAIFGILTGNPFLTGLGALELTYATANDLVTEYRAQLAESPAGSQFLASWDLIGLAMNVTGVVGLAAGYKDILKLIRKARDLLVKVPGKLAELKAKLEKELAAFSAHIQNALDEMGGTSKSLENVREATISVVPKPKRMPSAKAISAKMRATKAREAIYAGQSRTFGSLPIKELLELIGVEIRYFLERSGLIRMSYVDFLFDQQRRAAFISELRAANHPEADRIAGELDEIAAFIQSSSRAESSFEGYLKMVFEPSGTTHLSVVEVLEIMRGLASVEDGVLSEAQFIRLGELIFQSKRLGVDEWRWVIESITDDPELIEIIHNASEIPVFEHQIVARKVLPLVSKGEKTFKRHFLNHKVLLRPVTGKTYRRLEENGPEFLEDLSELIASRKIEYVGMGTMFVDQPVMYIFRGENLTIVVNKEGAWETLLEMGKGRDKSIWLID